MKLTLTPKHLLVLAVVVLGPLLLTIRGCSGKAEKLAVAKERVRAAEVALQTAQLAATAAVDRADSLERATRQDSAHRDTIRVREVQRVQLSLEGAHAAADTVRRALQQAAPQALPALDHMRAAYASALAGKDRLLELEHQAYAQQRLLALSWKGAATRQGKRADAAERALYEAKRAVKIAASHDFLGLDFTCGPGVGVYEGTRGLDVGVGVSCNVGR